MGTATPRIRKHLMIAIVGIEPTAEFAGLFVPTIFHFFGLRNFIRTLETNSPVIGRCSRGPEGRGPAGKYLMVRRSLPATVALPPLWHSGRATVALSLVPLWHRGNPSPEIRPTAPSRVQMRIARVCG